MKVFTLIEADRYIKVDDKGIFFTKENWPFTDIEHLWAIQWKNGNGWVEYDSPIPNTPITEEEIQKYVDHYNVENERQIAEQKAKEEEEKKRVVSWEEAMKELELQMDNMQKNHDDEMKEIELKHDTEKERLYTNAELHEKEHKRQMTFLMKDHELQVERIQQQVMKDHDEIFMNQDEMEDIAKDSQGMFDGLPKTDGPNGKLSPMVTLFDGEVDESLFDDAIDDNYFDKAIGVDESQEFVDEQIRKENTDVKYNSRDGDSAFQNFDLSKLDDEFDLEMMFEEEEVPVVDEIEKLIIEDDKPVMRCVLGGADGLGFGAHELDTALGNRLYHWEQAQSLYGENYRLSFEQKYYPESEFFNFPNTVFEDDGTWDETVSNLQDQWEETWLQTMAGQKQTLTALTGPYDNHISTITLKDPNWDKKFKTLFGKYHAIHLRRGSGTWLNDDDISSIPDGIREDYLEYYKKSNDGHTVVDSDTYQYIQDSQYFNEMDGKKKYYIAADIPSKYYSHWKDKYKIVDKNDLMDKFKKICSVKKKYVAESLIDFIALAYSKGILAHKGSTFNLTAARWKATPIVNIGRS